MSAEMLSVPSRPKEMPADWLTFLNVFKKNKRKEKDRRDEAERQREIGRGRVATECAFNFVNILPMTRNNSLSINLTIAGTGMEALTL